MNTRERAVGAWQAYNRFSVCIVTLDRSYSEVLSKPIAERLGAMKMRSLIIRFEQMLGGRCEEAIAAFGISSTYRL